MRPKALVSYICIYIYIYIEREREREKSSMNTVLFVNATMGFSENLFLVFLVFFIFKSPI